jgi:exosortase
MQAGKRDVAFSKHLIHSESLPMSVVSSGPQRWQCPDWPFRAVISCTAGLLLVGVFREMIANCVDRWTTEPQYSHGFVIPVMALGLGWVRREKIPPGSARCSVKGLGVMCLGAAAHLLATWYCMEALDAVGFLLILAGLTSLIWGRHLFHGLWPAILFLAFMLPLPFQMERMLSEPLQMLGASQSVWYIQAMGIPAIAQGNTILMLDMRLGVAEAFSGLRMLMVFLAISVAAVLISDRTRWEKLLIVFSAIPIALIINITRIVATAVAHHYAGRGVADLIFYDVSGWLMMPFAATLLFCLLKVLDSLFIEEDAARPPVAYHRLQDGSKQSTTSLYEGAST